MLTTGSGFAQKRDGLYFSHDSYKIGEPDLLFEEGVKFSNRSNGFALFLSQKDIQRLLKDSSNKEIRLKQIWAVVHKSVVYVDSGIVYRKFDTSWMGVGIPFNDGSKLIVTEVGIGTNQIAFIKLLIVGKICLSMDAEMFLLNEPNKKHKLKVSVLKRYISDDLELLGRFKKEKSKKNQLIPYIKLYNSRNSV